MLCFTEGEIFLFCKLLCVNGADEIICKKVNNQKSMEQAAMDIEERSEDIRLLYEIIRLYAPNFNEEQIYQTYLEKIQEKTQ